MWFKRKQESTQSPPPLIPQWASPTNAIEFHTLSDESIAILSSLLSQLTLRGNDKTASLEIVNIAFGLSLQMHERKLLTMDVHSCEYEPPVEKYTVSRSLKVTKRIEKGIKK